MTVSNHNELERRVVEVLHQHAEIAMSSTDTEVQHAEFTSGIESSVRHRRIAWGIGAVAAAAAVVLALVLGGVPGLSSNQTETQLPARERTPVQIARDFIGALAGYDAAKAAQDVVAGEARLYIWPGDPTLPQALQWAEAARFKILPKDCVRDRPSGDMTTVKCQFDWHFLGSDDLGQVPRVAEFSLGLRGGRIQSASTSMDWSTFGLRRDAHGDLPMWRPFVSWLEREHPDDVEAMIAKGVCCSAEHESPIYTDKSRALWAKYVDEWVESQQ
jgi:hypothetical protein